MTMLTMLAANVPDAALGVVGTLVVAGIVAAIGWVVRASRADGVSTERVARVGADAARAERDAAHVERDVERVDETLRAEMRRGFESLGTKLDGVAARQGALEVSVAKADTAREALVANVARAESVAESTRAALAAADTRHAQALAEMEQRHAQALAAAIAQQDAARHALRDQMHAVMGDGLTRGIALLERLVETSTKGPRKP